MIQGVELSRRFFAEVVEPWLARAFPGLAHAAALIGPGSEVLGFDDAMSADHDWGARVLIFVAEAGLADRIADGFAAGGPQAFLGAPVIRGGVEVWTLEAYVRATLGLEPEEPRDNLAWLGLAEQRLLAFTAGAVFRDDDRRLTALRARLAAPPRDVSLYKLAGQWRRIAEEQPFVGRAGLRGDELGSRIIAARLARDAMRLAFQIEGRYAPYPKWFGSAFAQLPCAVGLTPLLERALAAQDWKRREAVLAETFAALARLQLARGWPGAPSALGLFHDRPFTVINADAIIAALRAEIADPALRALPVIGALDQVTDATPVIEAPGRARAAMRGLFDDREA